MKRSTTPTSKTFTMRGSLLAIAILVAAAGPLALLSSPVDAARNFAAEIQAVQSQIDQYSAEAARLAGEARTLQNEIARLNSEKAVIQGQIDLSQAKYDKLVADIQTTEKKIADNQNALGKTMADMYVDTDISPLEMLASSRNIGDYVDKQTQRSSIRDTLRETIDEIKRLKKELESQKVEVEQVLAVQTNQRNMLVSKEAEQQNLLNDTKGQEAAYQSLVGSAQQKMAEIRKAQQDALARATNGGRNSSGSVGGFYFRNFSGNMGCSGGYPYCQALDSVIDQWSLYNRECVSYTAWAAYYRFGKDVSGFAGMGNAYQWPSTAANLMGATVNQTPAVGSVAIIPPQAISPVYGHSMMVEEILSDGWLRVSQYNFGGTGEYSTMEIPPGVSNYVHFRNR